jgi:RNA polymerase II subunit A-like phosphatase
LQRIKESRERSSGLRQVANITSPKSPETTTRPARNGEGDELNEIAEDDYGSGPGSHPEDPDDDDDELEKEMLAAFEESSFDESVEADAAIENG